MDTHGDADRCVGECDGGVSVGQWPYVHFGEEFP